MLDSEARSRITGASHHFMRACYAVEVHGDGTGTIVLDWYETSIGLDYGTSITFMRTEIETARQIVRMLNEHLPGRVNARTEYAPDDEEVSSLEQLKGHKQRLEGLSDRIHARLIDLLAQDPDEEQEDLTRAMEADLERLGGWVSRSNMTPKEYCTQVFLMAPEYIGPVLESALKADFDPEQYETARDLVEAFLCFLPSWTNPPR